MLFCLATETSRFVWSLNFYFNKLFIFFLDKLTNQQNDKGRSRNSDTFNLLNLFFFSKFDSFWKKMTSQKQWEPKKLEPIERSSKIAKPMYQVFLRYYCVMAQCDQVVYRTVPTIFLMNKFRAFTKRIFTKVSNNSSDIWCLQICSIGNRYYSLMKATIEHILRHWAQEVT